MFTVMAKYDKHHQDTSFPTWMKSLKLQLSMHHTQNWYLDSALWVAYEDIVTQIKMTQI